MEEVLNLDGKEVLIAEREKIIRLVKNWKTRVENQLKMNVSLEAVKNKWTRLLDIDLLISDDEQPEDAESINEMFKVVISSMEKGKKASSYIDYSDEPALVPMETSHPVRVSNKVALSDQTIRELTTEQNALTSYFNSVEKRFESGTNVDRKRMFAKMNGYLAISAMLGKIDCARVDAIFSKVTLTPAEIRFISKKHNVLHQHLLHTSGHLFEDISSNEVRWEQVFTQRQQPMLIVDSYLFYKDRTHLKNRETINYFKCIRSRKGSDPKCSCRVKMDSANTTTVTFTGSRTHNHPPDWLEIKRYGIDSSIRRLEEDGDLELDPDHNYVSARLVAARKGKKKNPNAKPRGPRKKKALKEPEIITVNEEELSAVEQILSLQVNAVTDYEQIG